jgi:dolichol kinase
VTEPVPPARTPPRRLPSWLRRDVALPDEIGRRLVHGAGALVLVYYLLPGELIVVPKSLALLLALAAAGLLELLRLAFGVRLPMIRGYELRRPASYLFYAVALVLALLLFPEPIAVAVVLGTAIVDPVAGELRSSPNARRLSPVGSFAVYAVLASVALGVVGRWPWEAAAGLGGVAAAVGVAVERWRFRWLDDDLTMTIVPAVVLYAAALALGLPR